MTGTADDPMHVDADSESSSSDEESDDSDSDDSSDGGDDEAGNNSGNNNNNGGGAIQSTTNVQGPSPIAPHTPGQTSSPRGTPASGSLFVRNSTPGGTVQHRDPSREAKSERGTSVFRFAEVIDLTDIPDPDPETDGGIRHEEPLFVSDDSDSDAEVKLEESSEAPRGDWEDDLHLYE